MRPKHSLLWAAALLAALGLLASPSARAQTTLPSITPQPSASPVFPINQPQTFQYTDAQGTGTITFVDLGVDPNTGFDILRVSIAQNGLSYTGSGIATPIPGAARPFTNLVSFSVISSTGIAYFFEGKMGLGVEFQGQGTYFPVNNPTSTGSWGLLFVAGNPPPTGSALSLSLDRGCGSTYPLGASQTITYSSSVNDTLTLLNQRSDGTFVLFANQPVVGGQTYQLNTFVSNVPGLRTLILRNSSGQQVTCSFTGAATPPTGPILTLNLDRGCGSFYPLGSAQTITYSSSVNDTLTLLVQRGGSTFALFSNQPVIAGQTYAYQTSVAFVAGPRTLILQDASGVQTTCSFTGG